MNGWMDTWKGGRSVGWKDLWNYERLARWINVQMDEWKNSGLT